jgi:hypothetical protein
MAANDEKVKALQAAYPNEILDEADVGANRSWNSYSSRHYDAQGNLIDDTVELHKQFEAAHPSPAANTPTDTTAPAANAPAADSVSPSATPVADSTAPSIAPADISPTPSPTDVSSPTPTL